MGKAIADYTVYSRKTTLPVAFGTPAECARAMGITRGTFTSMASRSRKRPDKRYIFVREDKTLLMGTGD